MSTPSDPTGDVECVLCMRRFHSGDTIAEDSPICPDHAVKPRRRPRAATLPPPPPMRLAPEILYMGDNGRLHCGAPPCAGVHAAATGVGLDGEPCVAVDRAIWLAWTAIRPGDPMACEGCGLEATGTPGPTGAVLTRERRS